MTLIAELGDAPATSSFLLPNKEKKSDNRTVYDFLAVMSYHLSLKYPRSDINGPISKALAAHYAEEFSARGLNPKIAQCNTSLNRQKGTLRGMHYQIPPHEEAKLVRCTAGAINDVIIDLRPDSDTFRQWTAIELTATNHRQLYIPEGFAHGFQTLVDNTEVLYQMSAPYVAESARGVRWNDPAFGIDWPPAERIIIARDQTYPDFTG